MRWTIKTSELRAPENHSPLDVLAVLQDDKGTIRLEIPEAVIQTYPNYDIPEELDRARMAVKLAIWRLEQALLSL